VEAFQGLRRGALRFVVAAWLVAAAGLAWSQTLRLVVPFPAGGTADVLPRLVADKLMSSYPGGVIVDNRSGAGGNIGAEFVYRSEPNGLTLLVSPPGPIAINQNLYKKLSFDPTRWVPITVLATAPNVLDVSTKVPAANVKEFIAYLKAHPGKVSVATQGIGSTSHLTAALFMQLTGTDMTLVPYKGTAPALVDVVGGNVDVFFDNLPSSAIFHNSGKLRILAVADKERSKALPQVPSFGEAGLPDMLAVTFFTIVAPPGTPPAVAQKLNKQIADVLAAPDMQAKFADQGVTPGGWSTEQTAKFLQTESARWAKVIKSANVTLD
jgi:tripartite-type tricarboxylate transporter receptor subunit TctC